MMDTIIIVMSDDALAATGFSHSCSMISDRDACDRKACDRDVVKQRRGRSEGSK